MMLSQEERSAVRDRMRPPSRVVDWAVKVSLRSPCTKSQRGVVLFSRELVDIAMADDTDPGSWVICSEGHNGPPRGFVCDASNRCKAACGKVCLHAEDRAIREAAIGAGINSDLELVHVKTVNGQLVAEGGPSCWQCSRLVVEVGLRGVWLYEAQRWHVELTCQACRRITVVPQGGGTTGVCKHCNLLGGLLEVPGHQVYDQTSGVWRVYTAEEFHLATLKACDLPAVQQTP